MFDRLRVFLFPRKFWIALLANLLAWAALLLLEILVSYGHPLDAGGELESAEPSLPMVAWFGFGACIVVIASSGLVLAVGGILMFGLEDSPVEFGPKWARRYRYTILCGFLALVLIYVLAYLLSG